MTIKVIDVGCGGKSSVKNYIEEYLPEWKDEKIEITRMDAQPNVKPDILHDLLKPIPMDLYDKFDLVYMTHVLEHIPWRNSVSVANEVSKMVKVGGYFLLAVPSMEWACKELLRGNYNMTVLMTIYGGQDDDMLMHKCGFTKPVLEMLADKLGMKIYSLRETGVVVIANASNGHAMQHVMLLRKETNRPDASEAIA